MKTLEQQAKDIEDQLRQLKINIALANKDGKQADFTNRPTAY